MNQATLKAIENAKQFCKDSELIAGTEHFANLIGIIEDLQAENTVLRARIAMANNL